LNAACMEMEMEMEMQRHERLQAAGPEFPLQIRSRGYNLNGPTEEQDEASIRPPPGSSIASLLSLIGSLGQAVDEHEKLLGNIVPSQSFLSPQPKVSHLFAFATEIESVIRDVAWRPFLYPWDDAPSCYVPPTPTLASSCNAPSIFFPRAALPAVCAQLLGAKGVVNQTRPDQETRGAVLPRIVGNSRPGDPPPA
jgi:hypothetical protein